MTGHVRPHGDRKWVLVVETGKDHTGKRRQKTRVFEGGERAANTELRKWLKELEASGSWDAGKLTVAQYLERWLSEYVETQVRPKTLETYQYLLRQHVIPALGHHKLAALSPAHIQSYYSEALTSGRKNGKGGLSKRTVLHQHRVLREALQHAVRWRVLPWNPADAATPPAPEREERAALTGDETAQLPQAARNTRLFLPILLAVVAGLRRGEILGLRWDSLDLSAGLLRVRQAYIRAGGVNQFADAKTHRSRRAVKLPAELAPHLEHQLATLRQDAGSLGPDYQDQGLVCPRLDGTPWSPGAFSNAFADLIAKLKIPQVTFHDLRHTHSSLLHESGVDLKVIQERLGHSTLATTADIYTHLRPHSQDPAAAAMGTFLGQMFPPPPAIPPAAEG